MSTIDPTGKPAEFALVSEEPDEASDRSPEPVEDSLPRFVDRSTPQFPGFAETSAEQAPAPAA